jgi:hypothetical protein
MYAKKGSEGRISASAGLTVDNVGDPGVPPPSRMRGQGAHGPAGKMRALYRARCRRPRVNFQLSHRGRESVEKQLGVFYEYAAGEHSYER